PDPVGASFPLVPGDGVSVGSGDTEGEGESLGSGLTEGDGDTDGVVDGSVPGLPRCGAALATVARATTTTSPVRMSLASFTRDLSACGVANLDYLRIGPRVASAAYGSSVSLRIVRPTTIAGRLRGLIGREGLPMDEALLLVRCRCIHTFG